jgi:hypothetical protein
VGIMIWLNEGWLVGGGMDMGRGQDRATMLLPLDALFIIAGTHDRYPRRPEQRPRPS